MYGQIGFTGLVYYLALIRYRMFLHRPFDEWPVVSEDGISTHQQAKQRKILRLGSTLRPFSTDDHEAAEVNLVRVVERRHIGVRGRFGLSS